MKVLQQAIREYQLNMSNMAYPPCFQNKDKYIEWRDMEAIAHTEPREFVCRDCSSSFQRNMMKQDRCLIPSIPVRQIVR